MNVGKTGWNLGAEVGPDFLLGERLPRREALPRLGILCILSSRTSIGFPGLGQKVGDSHLASIGLDHSDRTIAVAQEPGDFLCFFELTHLVQQGCPSWGEGKVDEQVRHVLVCAILDSIHYLLEA